MDFEERLRSLDLLGGQRAPLASDGVGVRLLHRCDNCQRIWLQDGKSAILDLQAEQIQRFAQELSANLDCLPHTMCRMCLWRKGGGSISIDEYDRGEGFGLCWEIPSPLVIHATSAILSPEGALALESRPDVLTQKEKLCAVLRSIKEAHPPDNMWFLDQAFIRMQAAEFRPGFGQTGTEHWQWQGWYFTLDCPPLGGSSLVTLMLALPPGETVSPNGAFRTWQSLIELTLLSGIPGEHA